MTLTAGEQYLLELINRARLDPAAEAARYNMNLNTGLTHGTIGTGALQVLAPDAALEVAADDHSIWMLQTSQFSHTGRNGSNAGDRIQSSGYRFEGTWGWRENLAWVGSTGSVDMGDAIEQHHAGLFRSHSHRVNTFASDMQEIGIGQVAGQFTQGGTTYNSSMLTENFAMSGGGAYVTGVAYRDSDRDQFYSMGEGQNGVWFRAGGQIDRTTAAGGYGVHVGLQDDLTVSIGRNDQLLARVEVDTSAGNVKLDLVTQANGTRMLETSGDTTLVWGVGNARLLGSANLELTGSGVANTLEGNRGANRMDGAGGNDTMRGMDGNDTMMGGAGNDRVYGGNGHDRVVGNDGTDRLNGGNGHDKLFGGRDADVLIGERGNDVLWGQLGNDRLYGGDGNDIVLGNAHRDAMYGGNGNDRMDGGAGDDRMEGGAGADLFIFSAHRDTVVDFQDNVDTIAVRGYLRDGFGSGTTMTVAEAMGFGEIRGGNAVFDFGNNHVLTVIGVEDLSILANDMIII